MNAGANLTTAMRLLRQQIEQAEKLLTRRGNVYQFRDHTEGDSDGPHAPCHCSTLTRLVTQRMG